jgi:AraC family transcriptional activator of pobA
MSRKSYPVFDINGISAHTSSLGLLNAERFSIYRAENPHLDVLHGHTFYHLLYFTKGSGSQIIDFEKFEITPGMIYFMKPGQVHQWFFQNEPDGFIINFSPTFFDSLFVQPAAVLQFPFFDSNNPKAQVIQLSAQTRNTVEPIFGQIIEEKQNNLPAKYTLLAALLLKLFVVVARDPNVSPAHSTPPSAYSTTFISFQQLVEQHFRDLHLPKEYAKLLFVTPAHLNQTCQEHTGLTAGVFIRNRILLEAKRLLVNFNLSVADIATQLNFIDNSYFVRFFKKYTGITPEAFRKKYYQS